MRRLAAFVMALWLPGAGMAQEQDFCAPLQADDAVTRVAAIVGGPEDTASIQAGLRAALDVDNARLEDSIVGPVTVGSLADLCVKVPQVSGTGAIQGTIDLARNYGRMANLNSSWRTGLDRAGLIGNQPPGGFNRDLVRLAGGAFMSAAALAGTDEGDSAVCTGLTVNPPDLNDSDRVLVQKALAAITSADPDLETPASLLSETSFGPSTQAAASDVCLRYPVQGGLDEFVQAMLQFSSILAQRPDAVNLLGSSGFGAWTGGDFINRIIRLLGTAPAVVALLGEYQAAGTAPAAAAGVSAPILVDSGTCPRPAGATDLEYYSLSPDEVEGLKARSDVGAALKPVMEARFARIDDLIAAATDALKITPGSCADFRLRSIVEKRASGTEVYSLDAQKTADMKLQPELSDVLPALDALGGAESSDQGEFSVGVRAKVTEAAQAASDEAVKQAAEIAAQAAEDVSPPPDTPAEGIPAGEAAEPEPEFAITDQSLTVIQAQVTDPDFYAAISQTPEQPMASRDLIAATVQEALAPIAAQRAAEATNAAMGQLEEASVITLQYRLTQSIINDLKADPEFAAISAQPLEALDDLAGISYPYERLLNEASILLPVPPVANGTPEDANLAVAANLQAISGAARKYVDGAARLQGPFAAECGCTAPRAENSLVYGFYPFWLAGPDPEFADAEAGNAEEDASGDTVMAGTEPVAGIANMDFELFERVAFDGLVIGTDTEIRNRRHWQNLGPNFVQSAHKHQAKADLAIRLEGWRGWNDDQIASIADNIESMVDEQPFPEDTGALIWLGHALDRLLSRRPDGVTLMVPEYRDVVVDVVRNGSTEKSYQLGNLIELVRQLHGRINADGVQINLAFDIDLSAENGEGALNLFRDLEVENILRGSDNPRIGNVLVFLERPTTQTKKLLRQEIENAFSGNARIQVLRSIIPIVPPGAHETIYSSNQPGVSYGQFIDDVFYFQDNFGGMGFWPVLPFDRGGIVRNIVMERFSPDGPTAAASQTGQTAQAGPLRRAYYTVSNAFQERMEPVCSFTCPRRLVGYFLIIVTGVSIGLLIWLSLYSSFWHRWARRLFLLPILFLLLLALLLLTQICDDPPLNWALLTFIFLSVSMFGILVFVQFQSKLDGPLP